MSSIKEKLMTQADRFSEEEVGVGFGARGSPGLGAALLQAEPRLPPQVKQMFAAFPPDVCGNLDYRNLCYVITHGEEKD
ncbi:Hypothetical predicted protein [Marmota monax]|uniref:Uncharacterized protein n=1 Tax=Marmota monax TaxID=9995 RepID=A0A5E4CK60_MARMO|nr:hypothetical protein GHT09_011457 [Marmota monax]VTJ82255.1 Hypothetical predicted protein [Marmota monax]